MTEKDYFKVHGWLRRNCKKSNICSHCKTATAKKYDWALKKGCSYEENIDNFIELCRSCHIIYDYTEDKRKNLSESQKKNYKDNPNRSENQGSYRRKIVEQYSLNKVLIKEFKSMREAERQTGVDVSLISNCCNNKGYNKTAGGFIWKYKAIEEALKLI